MFILGCIVGLVLVLILVTINHKKFYIFASNNDSWELLAKIFDIVSWLFLFTVALIVGVISVSLICAFFGF